MHTDIKKVAIYPGYANMLGDAIFDVNSDAWKALRGLPIFERYVALKKHLNDKGIALHTYDQYKNFKEIDVWLMLVITPRNLFFFLRHGISFKKIIPIFLEPNVINTFQWKYIFLWSRLFTTILTWSPLLASYSNTFIRYNYIPYAFDASRRDYFMIRPKKNLCLLLQSNKASKVHGELYSLRRKVIRYFEKRGDKLLDLFGYGWNTPHTRHLGPSKPFYTPLYKGMAEDKWETFALYKYIFCIQNAIPAGQFEGDIFMAMTVGAVPIYVPPEDADLYIPKDTYINYNDFANLDDLVAYIKKIEDTEVYETYRTNGWNFITSERFNPFTVTTFAESVYGALMEHAKRNS